MRIRSCIIAAIIAFNSDIAHATSLPDDAVVLSGRWVGAMLHQCSRETPAIGESNWQPTVDDILALESILQKALTAQAAKNDPDWSAVPNGWKRQYVGLVVGDRRLIYGNFFPANVDARKWRAQPFVVCDGGPQFFGVVYDVADHRIINLAFNGEA